MKTSDLITRYRNIFKSYLDGVADEVATDAEVVVWLNEALVWVAGALANRRRRVPLTVGAGVHEISGALNFNPGVRAIEKLYIDGVKLPIAVKDQFESQYLDFEYGSGGRPVAMTFEDPNRVLLSCPVDAATAALSWTATVLAFYTPLSHTDLNREPEIPKEYHVQLARLAAVFSAKDYALDSDQKDFVEKTEKESKAAFEEQANKVAFAALPTRVVAGQTVRLG